MDSELSDLSPMPFGQHKGKPMQDVPASYLHWLWTSGVKNEHSLPIHRYIKVSMNALKQETPDLIW